MNLIIMIGNKKSFSSRKKIKTIQKGRITMKEFVNKCIFSLMCAYTLNICGCSSSANEVAHVIDADRAKGTVDIGFIHDSTLVYINDGGKGANWSIAEKEAQEVCQKWGYKTAERLSDVIQNENNVSYDFYDGTSYKNVDSQKFVIKLQCIVEK